MKYVCMYLDNMAWPERGPDDMIQKRATEGTAAAAIFSPHFVQSSAKHC